MPVFGRSTTFTGCRRDGNCARQPLFWVTMSRGCGALPESPRTVLLSRRSRPRSTGCMVLQHAGPSGRPLFSWCVAIVTGRRRSRRVLRCRACVRSRLERDAVCRATVVHVMGDSPAAFVRAFEPTPGWAPLMGFVHRWIPRTGCRRAVVGAASGDRTARFARTSSSLATMVTRISGTRSTASRPERFRLTSGRPTVRVPAPRRQLLLPASIGGVWACKRLNLSSCDGSSVETRWTLVFGHACHRRGSSSSRQYMSYGSGRCLRLTYIRALAGRWRPISSSCEGDSADPARAMTSRSVTSA